MQVSNYKILTSTAIPQDSSISNNSQEAKMQSARGSAAAAAAVGRVREGTSRSRSLFFDYYFTRPAPCKHGAADLRRFATTGRA